MLNSQHPSAQASMVNGYVLWESQSSNTWRATGKPSVFNSNFDFTVSVYLLNW